MELSQDLPPEEKLTTMIRGLHRAWRLATLIPMVYLLAGLALQSYWFTSGEGLMPLSEGSKMLLVGGGALLAVTLWALYNRLEARHLLTLKETRDDAEGFYQLASEQQLQRFILCDLASMPGIVVFLFDLDAAALMAFCLISMVFYLRAMPSERKIGTAFLRPELIQKAE